jgi:S1-C subfamily serine protease
MNILDILIGIALLFSLVGGFRRGLWLTLAHYAGLAGGFIAGARFAPDVVDWAGIENPTGRQLAAFGVLILAVFLGGSLGFRLAGPLRRWLTTRRLLGMADSLAGAALSGVVTLIVVWLLTVALARGPLPEVARTIQQSLIARRLDAAIPLPPAFLTRVQQILSGSFLPPIFAGLEPRLPEPVMPPAEAVETDGIRAAAAATVRVQGLGCGGVATGSGFLVEDGLIVTNAHVVSGTTRITVAPPGGDAHAATVALFDPQLDLAILRAADVGGMGLTPGNAQSGTIGAVIGYPGGGPQQVSPAQVDQRFTATGRDIYNERVVTREIWSVSANVRPGNSGGPLVDRQGRYIGAVFASSISNPGHAYALAAEEITPNVQRAAGSRRTINTRDFACVR